MRRLWLPADWSGTFRKHANQKRGLICNFFFWIFFKVWNSGGVQPSAAASSSAVDTAIRGEDISFTQASGMEVSTRRAPLGVEIWADPALIASRMVCTVVKAADKTSLRANRAAKAMLRYFYQTERPRLHRHESANARSKAESLWFWFLIFRIQREIVPRKTTKHVTRTSAAQRMTLSEWEGVLKHRN